MASQKLNILIRKVLDYHYILFLFRKNKQLKANINSTLL